MEKPIEVERDYSGNVIRDAQIASGANLWKGAIRRIKKTQKFTFFWQYLWQHIQL